MMATAEACKGVPFTYIWTIENVPKLTPINLKSPRFISHSIRKETWYLQIIENEVVENIGNCFRCRLEIDEETIQTDDTDYKNLIQELLSISVEFSLLADDGSPLISKRSEESKWYVTLMTSAAFSERRAEFITNNKLRVQFRMWKTGYEILTTDVCFARTKLMTYRRSFVWAVEDFSALRMVAEKDLKDLVSDEKREYILKPFSSIWPSMILILYLKRCFGCEDVNVDFVTSTERNAFGCEISIFDANGKVIVSKTETRCMDKNLEFRPLISRSELMANKNLYVPNDTLLLRCFLEIPFGDISNRIEYCTPNVSTGAPPRFSLDLLEIQLHLAAKNNPSEFEEYFTNKEDGNYSSNMTAKTNRIESGECLINQIDDKNSLNMASENNPLEFEDDSSDDDPFDDYDIPNCSKMSKSIPDSCKDSCTLRTALKYLHNDPTLSDISLKLGTKCYPGHRNILSSRSPVFKKILNNDTIQKTIEIEDMEENTFCRLLQFIYTDTVEDLDFENALDLYKAADFYQLLDLRNKCSYFLGNNLHKADLCEIMDLANKCQDQELEKRIREVQEFYRRLEELRQSSPVNIAELMKSVVIDDDLSSS